MLKRIYMKAGLIEAVAELNNTRSAQAIWEALPIKDRANLWGEEVYFSILVSLKVTPFASYLIQLLLAGEVKFARQARLLCLVESQAMLLS